MGENTVSMCTMYLFKYCAYIKIKYLYLYNLVLSIIIYIFALSKLDSNNKHNVKFLYITIIQYGKIFLY